MAQNNSVILASDIIMALNKIFPKSIKNVDVEEDEEKNTFVFELEFIEEVQDLLIPDGIFISFIDFKGRFVEGFIDGESFIDFVKEQA
jgi:hypothetical protein